MPVVMCPHRSGNDPDAGTQHGAPEGAPLIVDTSANVQTIEPHGAQQGTPTDVFATEHRVEAQANPPSSPGPAPLDVLTPLEEPDPLDDETVGVTHCPPAHCPDVVNPEVQSTHGAPAMPHAVSEACFSQKFPAQQPAHIAAQT